MKNFILILFIFFFLFTSELLSEGIMYVAIVNNNADIYFMPYVNNPAVVRRLTFNSGMDNHPDYYIKTTAPYDTIVVWSSNRTGNFELYYGTLPNLEATAVQLTNNNYSDRHPHISHDGSLIVYTAKYRFEPAVACPKSECSIPVSVPCGWFEGLRIMKIGTWVIYDIDFRNMPITGGGVWPNNFATWVGHPSFSPANDKILFAAAPDSNGTSWEVYTVDYGFPNTLSNLTRKTQGTMYPANPNPIQMSAGAHFNMAGTQITYSSTRTPLGNSQIFTIPSASVNTPVSPLNQLTFHYGNDYVPEVLDNGKIVLASDLGPTPLCPPPDTGATDDLDIMIINEDGSGRINLTNNNANDEMLLIGDEVSWFCGIKPNLSECTFYPKYWNICWWRVFYRMGIDSTYLPNFTNRAIYTRAFHKVYEYMNMYDPQYFNQLIYDMQLNWYRCDTSWMNVQSWWIIPSLFGRRDTLIPPNPALLTPPNKVSGIPINPLLDWSDVSGALTYGVQVSLSPSFLINIVNVSGLSSSQYTVSPSLNLNTLYYWRAGATNSYGTSWSTVWRFSTTLTDIKRLGSEVPVEFKLYNNYPNPFNPVTKIKFDLPKTSFTVMIIYDLLGKSVAKIIDKELREGYYEVSWDGSNFASGFYFCRIISGDFTAVKRMVLIK